MATTNLSLTKKELDIAFKNREFSDQSQEIAIRLFTGKKEKPTELAVAYGLNRQRIYAIKRDVEAAYLAATSFPSSWRVPDFLASPELIEKFRKAASAEREKWLKDREKN